MVVSDKVLFCNCAYSSVNYCYYTENKIWKDLTSEHHLKNLTRQTHSEHTTTEVKTWTILIFAYTPLKMT